MAEETPFDFNAFNQHLIQLSTTFDYNSLQASYISAYTSITGSPEVAAPDGIEPLDTQAHRYVVDLSGKGDGVKIETLAKALADSTSYHILRRHYGMDESLVEKLHDIKDPLGGNLAADSVRSFVPGGTYEAILKRLQPLAQRLTINVVQAVTSSLLEQYDNELISRSIQAWLLDDYNKIITGMGELNGTYKLRTSKEFVQLLADGKSEQGKTLGDLKQTYALLVREARDQI